MKKIDRLAAGVCAAGILALTSGALAGGGVLDFRLDVSVFDANMDGFITGDEFMPVGSDGVQFTITPISNLVGGPRVTIDELRGLRFGGGGGSMLTFDVTPDQTIDLDAYTINTTTFILGNPTFDVGQNDGIFSMGNNANVAGTFAFEGGSLRINAGETFRFTVTNSGAAIQSFFESWSYTLIPAPGSAGLVALAGVVALRRRH